jgi:hypothetical protein
MSAPRFLASHDAPFFAGFDFSVHSGAIVWTHKRASRTPSDWKERRYMSDVIVAPHLRDLDELAKALAGWLGDRMPRSHSTAISNLSYPRGVGQSHETILFDALWNEAGRDVTQGFVVRIKPTHFTVFIDNRRQIAAYAGLAPSPWRSGAIDREQGVSKADSWQNGFGAPAAATPPQARGPVAASSFQTFYPDRLQKAENQCLFEAAPISRAEKQR